MKTAKLIDFRYFLFDLGKLPVILPGLLWLRPKWKFENKAAKKAIRGGAILMFNHSGFTDPILAQFAVWYRRQHFVATKELFQGPVRSKLFRIFKCIEIDRENFSFDTFRSITDHLNGGKIVSIYPEGHINGEETVAAFKAGIVMMALRSGCPIIPVYTKAPTLRGLHRAVFCIGEPICLRTIYGAMPSMDTVAKISDDLRQKVLQLEKICRNEV